MTQNYFEEKKTEFLNLLNNSFVVSKSNFIEDRIKFLNQLKDEIKKFYYSIEDEHITRLKKINLSTEFHSQIKTSLEEEKNSFASENFEENFKEYHTNIESYINSLPQTLEKPQEENNFKCSENNTAFICALLKIKNIYFSLKQRKNKDYSLWKRTIPYKNINQYYFNHKLNEKLIDLTYETNNSIAKEYVFIFKEFLNEFEKIFNLIAAENAEKNENEENSFSSNIDTAIRNVVLLKENLNSKLPEILSPIVDEYKTAIDKAGTVEAMFKKYSANDIKKIKEVEAVKNNQEKSRLERFTNGLFNNWNFYEDISLLNYFINEEFLSSKNQIEESLEKNIIPKFESIIQIFNEIKSEVNTTKDKTDLAQLLKIQQQKLKTTLRDDLLVELMRLMPLNNPAPLITSFNVKVKDYIEKFPGERIIANLNELDYNIRKSGFETIASKEIILRSVFNKAQQRLNNIADEANERIQIASSTVMELNEIADYNFETALSILETESITSEEKKKIEKDGLKVALEGINRIRERSKELISDLTSLNEKTFGDFQIVINDFSSNLFKLNNTEELSKQKINLAKQKAKEEFNEQVSNIKTGITNVIPILISKSKNLYHLILTKVFKLSESIGLSSKAKEATEEILDYIVETEKQISKLPIVYQRLFKNQPVEEERFFIGRKQELQVINKAFLNWNKNKFAPVVIVSEKGAGASSLTNMAKKQIEKYYQVIHVKLSINIYQPDIFLQLISEKLGLEPVSNFEELIKSINSLASKKVIIMENIEALFLRTVNGFEVLKMYFQMLSLTNKKIFWIATCNKYAWDYLDKVLSIEDYFAYHVEFEKFSDTEIKDIIMKRHNMSGYKLNFLPSKTDLENKQFKKLNEEQKQIFLRNEFFEELNEISQSNVGLAQLFWLRSITSLSNNRIDISSLSNIDFSFLKSISKAKVFSLYALLIHDGLTIEQHAKVFNISTDESKLLLYTMHDDGEIVLKDNIYRVNFLLYVHTIKLLKVQNILH